MENEPLMINGKNIDHCNIQELQKFAKDSKGAIQYIGKPEPLLRSYIKLHLRNNPDIAEQHKKPAPSTLVVVKGVQDVIKEVAKQEAKKPETPKEIKPEAQKTKKVKPKKMKAKKAAQTKPKGKTAERSTAEKIVEPAQPKRVKRPYTRPLTATEIEKLCNKPEVKKIMKAECKLHVKMYKLNQSGFSRKQIAAICETLEGHVWNELTKYAESLKRQEKADAIKA